jgi:predicted nucleic acid-binding protein
MEPILIDTNLLVYVFDRRDPSRQEIALHVVRSLVKTGLGRLSAQCLSEFFSATTRRKNPILTYSDAMSQTEKLARAFVIFPVTQQVVIEALRGVKQYQFEFWDAQIWATARLNQTPILFNEDFNSGSTIEGVRFVNPFAENFQIQEWLAED